MAVTRKVKHPTTGEDVDAVAVKVKDASEQFSYLTLEDGTEITMRMNVNQVVRLLDAWDEQGNPMYSIDCGATLNITSPENLKRQPENEQ